MDHFLIGILLRPIASSRSQQNKPVNHQGMIPENQVKNSIDLEPKPLIAANSWQYNSKGEVVLFASTQGAPSLPSLHCQALR